MNTVTQAGTHDQTETWMHREAPSAELLASQADLIRVYARKSEVFASEAAMRAWLLSKGVDCAEADSRKGLRKLFHKIESGEARLLHDERSGCVVRAASAAKISVEVTLHGQRYPLIEQCQIFLAEKITNADLLCTDPDKVRDILATLKIRSAQVRDSGLLWETLMVGEDTMAGARRGLVEELGLSEEQAAGAYLTMEESALEYEAPLDWPGVHSVLEIHSASAVLPEKDSRPIFVELEAGDQITMFVAGPPTPLPRALLNLTLLWEPDFRAGR